MRRVSLAALVAVIVLAAIPAVGAPNLYGTSGLIEVPDDIIYPVGAFSLAYHVIVEPGDSDDNLNFFTIGTGLLPNLDISGGVKTNGDTDAVINAKYRLAAETIERPSITIGVVDAAGELSPNDDPGIYIEFGKNLTAAAEEVAGGESKPLHGYLGFGTGVMKGVFIGLNWTLAPKLSATVEYLSKGLKDDPHFNVGIRLALTNELRLDAGLFDMDDFTGGISYNLARF